MIGAVGWIETRADDRPTNHDDLLGLDDGRGLKAG